MGNSRSKRTGQARVSVGQTASSSTSIRPSSNKPASQSYPGQTVSSQTYLQPSSVIQPTSRPFSVIKPASQPSSVIIPASQPSSIIKPASQPSSVIKPASQPSSVIIPASQPSSVIIPASQPSSIIKPASQPSSVIIPASQPSSVIKPSSQLSSVIKPASHPSSVIKPASQPSSVIQPASQPSSVIKPASQPFIGKTVSSPTQQNASQPAVLISSTKTDLSLSQTPIEVHATCCFPASNYIINGKEKQMVDLEITPRAVADKFALRICPQYNSRRSCFLDLNCRRIHICRSFCEEQCTKTHCNFDHSFNTTHNGRVLSCYQRRRDYSDQMVKDCLLNNIRHKRPKRNVELLICIHSIMGKCTQNKCSSYHASKPYLWEVKNSNGCWLELSIEQQNALEYAFSNPNIQKFSLPALKKGKRHFKLPKELYDILGYRVWTAYLNEFDLRNGCETVEIRRLSTPSDVTSNFGLSTRWIWYWMDNKNIWHSYTAGTIGKFYTYALSDQLEYMYHYMQDVSAIEVDINNVKYNINLEGKVQYNYYTGIQKICRRPHSRQKAKEEHFYDLWSPVPSCSKFLKVEIFHGTMEFNFVTSMFTSSLPSAVISRMYRVQNEFLWKAYQVKKEELMAKYKKEFLLKEQYLFHGTRHSVIDHICEENFDWRLCGSNVGHVYGKGTYFAKESSLSHRYAEAKDGLYAIFIALVLVGYCTVGNRCMEFPPRNTTTGYLYDTTLNGSSSEVFVKYNHNEYYPAYVLFYHVNSSGY
ncbi:protein mono-ADP-ribosyltransferase PARP12-like isoform X2 [Oratosquilla oratoria]